MHLVCRSFIVIGVLASAASAHVGISSGPAQANKTSIVTFSISHGCEDGQGNHLDTVKVKITIPAGIDAESIRALRSDCVDLTVHRTEGKVDYVEWTKPSGDVLAGDDGYYEVKLRLKPLASSELSEIAFNVEQTCNNQAGTNEVVVPWDGSSTNPPATLKVVPARVAGWNRITIERALTQDEVATYFGDATILWKGMSAYSPSSAIAMLIQNTPGVTPLTDGLAAGDQVWVKY